MKRRAWALVLLVVGAGLAGVVPASAASQDTTAESTPEVSVESADRTPPKLPERWRHTYGASGDDIFSDLVRTDDGGYLLVGSTGENLDGWVVKVDSEGEKQWSKTLGGQGTDRFWGVVETGDGYLVAGRTDRDGTPQGWLVEVGPDGEIRSNATLGAGAFTAIARSSANATDQSGNSTSGYLLAGWTYGDGHEGWLVGLGANRSEAWRATVPTPEGYDDGTFRAIVPTDSGYYLAGKLAGDSDDGWAVEVGPKGTLEWQTSVGGPSRDDVWAAAPAGNASDGSAGFVFAGETESDSDGPRDGWLVKFGPDGEVDWERKPGGAGTQWLDSAMRTDRGYLFTGSSDRGPHGSADGYVLATDDAGETRWRSYYGTGGWDKPWPAIRAHEGGYLLAGQTSGAGAEGKDGWLLRIGGSGSGATAANDTATSEDSSDGTTRGETGETADTSKEAVRDRTATTTDSPASVPGFGVGAALLALAGLLVALRR